MYGSQRPPVPQSALLLQPWPHLALFEHMPPVQV
jgi:hypothetical protein